MKPNIVKLLEEAGIPFKIIHIPRNPVWDAEVKKYIQKIEEGHLRAAESKLRFKGTTRSSLFYSLDETFCF